MSDVESDGTDGRVTVKKKRLCVLLHSIEKPTTFFRRGAAVAGLRIRVHNFTSSGCVHLF